MTERDGRLNGGDESLSAREAAEGKAAGTGALSGRAEPGSGPRSAYFADPHAALERTGALGRGHFRLSSGLHSDTYVQCATFLKEPGLAVEAGRALAELSPGDIDLVLCPALGGIVIGFTVALALERPMLFSERVGGSMELRRGFAIEPGARVLLVEDVVTTGGSAMELARMVEAGGGTVAGLSCIVERGGGLKSDFPVSSLVRIDASSWEPEDCPLCAAGRELDTPGSRHR